MNDSKEAAQTGKGLAPNLSLGPAPAGASKPRNSGSGPGAGLQLLILVVLIVNVGLVLLLFNRNGSQIGSGPATGTSAASSAHLDSVGGGLESLAIAFEDRSLWKEAGREWLQVALRKAKANERAKAYYRAGLMYEKAKEPERAAADR